MSSTTDSYPYDTIVEITDTVGNEMFQGSGVLIAPDEVLTASHVVYSAGVGTANDIVVTPGAGPSGSPFGSAFGTVIHYFPVNDAHDLITNAASQDDYAVIHLATPFSGAGTMSLLADFEGGTVNVSGYPGSASGAQVTQQQVVTRDPTYTLLDGTPLGEGSSGGPVWEETPDGPRVVGLVSSGSQDNTVGYDTQITAAALAQIDAWVAQDDPGTQAATQEPDLVLHGPHSEYTVAVNPAGGAVVIDQVSGRDGTQTPATLHDLNFTDGTGRFDPTGDAEDVGRLYKAAFGRAPDGSGLDTWANLLDAGTIGLSAVAQDFIQSTEFTARYGMPENTAFVDQLYQNVLGRQGDAAGVQYWTAALDGGASRAQVLLAFSQSFENKEGTIATIGDKDLSEAYRLYTAAFGEAPDTSGLDYWTTALDQGMSVGNIAQAFASSPEFVSTLGGLDNTGYVEALYANTFHRAADAAGVQFWTNQLAGGASRAAVLLNFSDSLENRIDTASATHDGWLFLG